MPVHVSQSLEIAYEAELEEVSDHQLMMANMMLYLEPFVKWLMSHLKSIVKWNFVLCLSFDEVELLLSTSLAFAAVRLRQFEF